jgi:hypothetical protein
VVLVQGFSSLLLHSEVKGVLFRTVVRFTSLPDVTGSFHSQEAQIVNLQQCVRRVGIINLDHVLWLDTTPAACDYFQHPINLIPFIFVSLLELVFTSTIFSSSVCSKTYTFTVSNTH